MGLQKKVNLYPSLGVPGDIASENPVVYTSKNYLSEGDVTVGRFVFKGSVENTAKASGDKILGLLRRSLQYVNSNIQSESSMSIPSGSLLSIVKKADCFAVSKTPATVGQKVFASTVDGTITTADAGSTVASHIETEWKVVTAGGSGEVIIITSW